MSYVRCVYKESPWQQRSSALPWLEYFSAYFACDKCSYLFSFSIPAFSSRKTKASNGRWILNIACICAEWICRLSCSDFLHRWNLSGISFQFSFLFVFYSLFIILFARHRTTENGNEKVISICSGHKSLSKCRRKREHKKRNNIHFDTLSFSFHLFLLFNLKN